MGEPRFRFMVVLAAVMMVATVLVCTSHHLPLRDPDDDALGPAYVRFPLFVLAAFLVDVLPRAVRRRGRGTGGSRPSFGASFRAVLHERWRPRQVRFMLLGLAGWYVAYATFRNLKNAVPFVNDTLWDHTLAHVDHVLWLGHDPAGVLHDLFGEGLAAAFFSLVYVAWIGLIPLTLMWALAWTRNHALASWFVTAFAVDWALGAITYFAVPTLGPVYSDAGTFAGLRATTVTSLQSSMIKERATVLGDPQGHHALQSIAAFASLHVGLMVTICLLVELAGARRSMRIAAWAFLALTVLATVYLGWHFFVDTLGGVVVGAAAVWVAALATGNHAGWRPRLVREGVPSRVNADASSRR